ncbi:MAG: hypothetical protein U0Z53_01665 [Blastocatellia bacterium]
MDFTARILRAVSDCRESKQVQEFFARNFHHEETKNTKSGTKKRESCQSPEAFSSVLRVLRIFVAGSRFSAPYLNQAGQSFHNPAL